MDKLDTIAHQSFSFKDPFFSFLARWVLPSANRVDGLRPKFLSARALKRVCWRPGFAFGISWLCLLLAGSALFPQRVSAAINFIQANGADPQTSQPSVPVTYTAAQTPGNLNVVAVAWANTTTSVISVTDTSGNTYERAVGPTKYSTTLTQSIYFAKNIRAAAANGNVVTVAFSATTPFPDVRILEYSGLDTSSPLDGTTALTGTATSSSSGPLATSNATDLLVAANNVADHT